MVECGIDSDPLYILYLGSEDTQHAVDGGSDSKISPFNHDNTRIEIISFCFQNSRVKTPNTTRIYEMK